MIIIGATKKRKNFKVSCIDVSKKYKFKIALNSGIEQVVVSLA